MVSLTMPWRKAGRIKTEESQVTLTLTIVDLMHKWTAAMPGKKNPVNGHTELAVVLRCIHMD